MSGAETQAHRMRRGRRLPSYIFVEAMSGYGANILYFLVRWVDMR